MSTFDVLESYVSLRRQVALLRAAETRDLDFGHNQISVIYKLSQAESCSMGELTEYTSSDKASMTRTVTLLQKAGFIKRLNDKKDRRVINIVLTAKGRQMALKAQEIRNSIGKKLESALTPAERKNFSQLVQKILNNLK